MADDLDIIDDDPKPASAPKSTAGSGLIAPPAKPASPQDTSRRNFLIGAGAGVVAGAVAGAGVVSVGTGGLPGGAARTSTGAGGSAGEPIAGKVLVLNVNGTDRELFVKSNRTLADVLREDLGLTGTKVSCNHSECSACAVVVNGTVINSCSELAIRLDGAKITTIEGLEKDGKLNPVQEAFANNMGLQCGFCTSGQIMQTYGTLLKFPGASEEVLVRHLSGNLCKCAAYPNILAAAKEASKNFKA